MAELRVTRVKVGDGDSPDRLLIWGSDDEADPEKYRTAGWLSAITNHFDPEAYLSEDLVQEEEFEAEDGSKFKRRHVIAAAGHLHPEAKPREMTEAEVAAYCLRLLREQNPELQGAEIPAGLRPLLN